MFQRLNVLDDGVVKMLFLVTVQVRASGGAAERPDRAAPERDDQPEAGAGQHGGEGGLPVLRESTRHSGEEGNPRRSSSRSHSWNSNI